MQFRALFTGAVLAFASLLALPAMAAVQTVTLSGAADAKSLSPLSLGDGAVVFGSAPKGTMTHVVFFETAKAGTAQISATPNSLGSIFDLSGLAYTVFDAATNAVVGSASASSILSFAAAAGGDYFVVFAGNASGQLGGNYTGNVALTPIPGAVLLLGPALAGLGYVGYRRRQSAA
jgi:hypothetical protein